MKKIIALVILPLLLASCDRIGSSKTSNLIDLTSRLEVENESRFNSFKTGRNNPFTKKTTKSYKLAKNTIIGQPAFAKGVQYSVDNKGYVSAFSIKNKKILWTADIAKDALDRHFNSGGVLFNNGRLYVTNNSRYLVVLDAKNGQEIIRKEFPDIIRVKPVMATENLLLVQTISNQLIAYNIKSSKLVWMHEGGIETISTKNHVPPVVYNGYAIASYSSGEVVYINATDGKPKWSYNLTNTTDVGLPSFDPAVIVTTPIISGEYAFFATSNGKVIKIDLDNGAAAWVKTADDVQSMSLVGNNLFVTNNARQVAALSTHNGQVTWVGNLISKKDRAAKKPKTATFQPPFVSHTDDGLALSVVASNGELYQFAQDASGKLPTWPKIIKIENGVRYYWISCCNENLHLILNYNIRY